MEMEEAKEKAKDVMGRVVETSKDAFSKAGDVIQKWGDKGVLKIEEMQLKSKRKDLVEKLGICAEKKLYIEKLDSISKDNEEISKILEDLSKIDAEIKEKKSKINEK